MAAPRPAPLLRGNRNWRLLWAGQAISAVGDMVFYVTALLWTATVIAKGEPWAPAAASGALIAAAVPAVVVGPIAGVFVDRWNRRKIMLVSDAARCVLVASLLVLPALRHDLPVGAQLTILYAVIVACSSFDQFFVPSRLAVIGAIVPEELQPAASGQLSASAAMAQVIGPPLAAPLLFTLGVQWALILNAASFAVSFLCVRAINVPLPASADAAAGRKGYLAELRDGLVYFGRSKVLIALGMGLAVALIGNGAINSLVAFFVPYNLHAGASWLGFVIGAVGVGAVAGSILTGRLSRRFAAGNLFWISLIGAGILLIGFSRSTALAPAIAFALALGLFAGVLNSVSNPIILSSTPPQFLGRVSSVLSPVLELSSMTGMIVAGTLASTVLAGFHATVAGVHLGPYDTILSCGGLLFVVGGLAAMTPMRAAGRPGAAGHPDAPQRSGRPRRTRHSRPGSSPARL